eukprot:CAMPEP_0204198964 /NCGR_PEP_ID=MMETSP0361-20130328/65665_1 /ASSEMBLY_ACC=CAM_ASM_000343 /TAXON_ID=268821 /ORGANISM="Scrippsiella Hangoei, Strain SHTV-5" /LENGTH=129 /DNA_ID=CAMNT_0051161171 /DNA_START=109 /DNA_END=499 /DNA_ORIENTATION=-
MIVALTLLGAPVLRERQAAPGSSSSALEALCASSRQAPAGSLRPCTTCLRVRPSGAATVQHSGAFVTPRGEAAVAALLWASLAICLSPGPSLPAQRARGGGSGEGGGGTWCATPFGVAVAAARGRSSAY